VHVSDTAETLPPDRMRQMRCPFDLETPSTPLSGMSFTEASFSKPSWGKV
jgi:hypothetical protein